MSVWQEWEWRGLLQESTEGLSEAFERETMVGYIGFDPTAASLHVGNLMTLMNLARLQRGGHSPIALVGGGTGLIGDPSGKSQERNLLTFEQVEVNAQGIRRQLERFLDFSGPHAARLANNVEWLRPVGFLDFLRDVGKHFTVNAMLAKESVKRRVQGEQGLSFTEFSYQLLQAYDFLVLHDRFGCNLQMGGSDQWGNIVSGCDLVRKVRGARVHGLVWPLMTTASGGKFGKTEQGTIWLDPLLTSPFQFHQFWLNTEDRDAARYLKSFTWLDRARIVELEQEVATAPEQRVAQRTLAREVTTMVHGTEEAQRAEDAAAVLFAGSLAEAKADDVLRVFADVPSIEVTREQLMNGVGVAELVVRAGLAASKGEATRLIRQGGIYVNDERQREERGKVGVERLIEGRVLILRKGVRERRLVMVL